MKKLVVIIPILIFSTLLAWAQNPGVTVQGAVTSGNCVKFVNRNLIADNGAACFGGASSFANPTATISTSAVNGVATTAMRSDAAPALASTIVAGGPTGSSSVIPVITWNAAGQLTAVTTASISVPTAANPTASVGLTAVNGSAATFMRSDAAPALDQSIAPTWLGMHTFSPSVTGLPITINSLAGSSLRELILKGMVTDAGNSQFLVFNSTSTVSAFAPSIGGIFAGSTQPSFTFMSYVVAANDTGLVPLISIAALRTNSATDPINGTLSAATTRPLFNIGGASGDYLSITATGNVLLAAASSFGFNSGALGSGAQDVFVSRGGAAALQLGAANAAAPITQSIATQGSRPGTDSSIGGGNLFIASGNGTGTGAISSLFLQSPVAVAAGVTAQTMTTGWTINKGVAASTGYTVATLPATPLTGSIAYVTNQLTTCAVAGAALTGGGAVTCPVFYNGVAWVGN